MRAACLLLLAAAVACGDNEHPVGEALSPAATLAIVAHPDDDLLFMQPDLLDAVRAAEPLTIVFVTAGDDGRDMRYVETRYAGLRAAYSALSGSVEPWHCGWIEIADHAAEHCRLDGAHISLVFLGYPDGGRHGELAGSLLSLWEGKIASATTHAPIAATYDREGLVAALSELIATAAPHTIRTLEVASTHGDDHSDHMLVGALSVLARARSGSQAELVAYRGYDVGGEVPDALEPIAMLGDDAFAHYSACVDRCAPCGQACPSVGASYAGWLRRRYAVGTSRRAIGALMLGGASLDASNGGVAMASGAGATIWQLAADGRLRTGDRCLAAAADGSLSLTDCAAATPIALDDEGHLWIASAPAPQPAMDLEHLACMAVDAGVPHAALCGAPSAPSWTILPAIASTARATLGFATTGRAVQLGDLTGDGRADLCTVGAGGLVCAPGDGAGHFAAAIRIDAPGAPLAIEPESLAIGDVDGDGRADACGRDAGGIVCATAATGFSAARFAPAFARTGAADATDRSLTIAAVGEVCAVTPQGVACAQPGGAPIVRSPWPTGDVPLWIADLDGDRDPDWCAAAAAGPACGRAADRAVTTDGSSWGFSWQGVVDGASGNGQIAGASLGGLADVDGDGRADLCAIEGTDVTCAPSQGAAFGPHFVRARFATPPSALWLGDLDGDGVSEPCVDLGDAIACAM